MTNETAPDLNFRCCGCGKIWTESHFPCDCPTDVLYQRDGKNSRLKSVWIKAKEVTALEAAQARIAELEGALRLDMVETLFSMGAHECKLETDEVYGWPCGLVLPINTPPQADDDWVVVAHLDIEDSEFGPKLWDYAISVLTAVSALQEGKG